MKLRKTYATRPEKILDAVIGFVGWWVINSLIWVAITRGKWLWIDFGAPAMSWYLLPLGIVALIFLAFSRRWLALGILVAVALNLAIALVLGLTQYGTCAIPFFMGLLPK